MTPDQEIAWAAGLFEGEGSITHTSRGHLHLSLAMTDLDMVERFCAAVGRGSIGGWQGVGPRKYTHQWYADGAKAAAVLRLLMPFLGERRLRTARRELLRRQDLIREATAPRPCAKCGSNFQPKFQPGHRQRFCSPKCWTTKAERRRRRAGLSPQ